MGSRYEAGRMIVDAHMHVWQRVHGLVRGGLPVVPLGNGRIRIGDEECLGMPAWMTDCAARAEYVVAEFDAAGVDCGVVVQEYLDGEQNDYLLEVLALFPGRFFAHALPNFYEPDEVAREASALFDRGFRGMKLCAGHLLGDVALDDMRFWPVYERMQAEGLVLSVDLSEGEHQVPEMERILGRSPELRVAVGHFAMSSRGGWPGQLRLARHPNVYVEGGGLVWLYRDDGFPFRGALAAIRAAIDEVGVDKLMWGSDWPRTMCDFTYRQSLDFVRASDAFSADEKAAFLGGNAARLYGLKAPSVARSPLSPITTG